MQRGLSFRRAPLQGSMATIPRCGWWDDRRCARAPRASTLQGWGRCTTPSTWSTTPTAAKGSGIQES